MISKTPQFDAALDAYFAGLEFDEKGGQWRTCRFSGSDAGASRKAGTPVSERFYVRPEDIAFYKEMGVPLPTVSPLERARRRMAFAPGYKFFKVLSAMTGKSIISVYPATTQFKIYEHELWFSDGWDPFSFGRQYDTKRSFFDAFRELQRDVPRPNLIIDSTSINSEYTNNAKNLKNCYTTFDGIGGENLYYTEYSPMSNDSVDCWSLLGSEQCYKSWGEKLYDCIYCQLCASVMESAFLFDCKNCEHCFMSSNLRNKKYYFYNTQLTKEEYGTRMKEIDLGDYAAYKDYLAHYEEMMKAAVHKNTLNERVINVVGDWTVNSRDCFEVKFLTGCERVAYAQCLFAYRDSYDVVFGTEGERSYECVGASVAGNTFGIKFSSGITDSQNLEYCDSCRDCHDCFGCIGLSHKAFCIFNVQYEEGDYWKKIDEIKTSMLAMGEYGEFFPPDLSPFPYNASLTTAYRGYDDLEEASRYGYRVEKIPEQGSGVPFPGAIMSGALPNHIRDTGDDIVEKTIYDETHGKSFRVTAYELEFYRRHNIPLPRIYPIGRMNQWRDDLDLRLRFFERTCDRCGKSMMSAYAPERPEKSIYCEECYDETIG